MQASLLKVPKMLACSASFSFQRSVHRAVTSGQRAQFRPPSKSFFAQSDGLEKTWGLVRPGCCRAALFHQTHPSPPEVCHRVSGTICHLLLAPGRGGSLRLGQIGSDWAMGVRVFALAGGKGEASRLGGQPSMSDPSRTAVAGCCWLLLAAAATAVGWQSPTSPGPFAAPHSSLSFRLFSTFSLSLPFPISSSPPLPFSPFNLLILRCQHWFSIAPGLPHNKHAQPADHLSHPPTSRTTSSLHAVREGTTASIPPTR